MVEPSPPGRCFPESLGVDLTVGADGSLACTLEPWMRDERGRPLPGSIAMLAGRALLSALDGAGDGAGGRARPLELRLQLAPEPAFDGAGSVALTAMTDPGRTDGSAGRAEGRVLDDRGNVVAEALVRATTEPLGELAVAVAERAGPEGRTVNILGVDMPRELLGQAGPAAVPALPDPVLRPALCRLSGAVTALGATQAGVRVPTQPDVLDADGSPDPGALAIVADLAAGLAVRTAAPAANLRALDFSVSYRWPAAAAAGPLDARASIVHRGLGTVVVSGDITGPAGLAVLLTTTTLVADAGS